jgi:(1->4)-alpha-D-glucan 1-alpha-D-glucosylmutase
VGGDPGLFQLDVDEFHRRNAIRAERFPRTLLAGSTHDTKRSADVRARIAALSSLAEEWGERVRAWFAMTESLVSGGAPDANERYLLFQTLVGTWPLSLARLQRYALKALREAKRNTSWVDQNDAWEDGVARYCGGLYDHGGFLADFEPFAARVAEAGERIALAELLLRLTCPGVPDVYQGDELPFFALVDPDNRRAVDWDRRRRVLASVLTGAPPTRETAKLHVITRALRLRADRRQSFEGAYSPLDAGRDACSFRRGDDVEVWVPLRGAASKPTPPPGYTDVLPELDLGLYVR